ncbi:MAG: hypothetical protein U0670_20460 [Anaerolineae bacterium]
MMPLFDFSVMEADTMQDESQSPDDAVHAEGNPRPNIIYGMRRWEAPLLNYTLSSVCPACSHPTIRRACKVRCERCGFMWDCSEL